MRLTGPFLLWSLLGVASGSCLPGAARAADEPSSSSPDAAAEAKVLRTQGLDHFKRKNYAQSVEAFQRALALQRTAGAMAQMASALNALSRYDEALRWYETVLAEFPKASEKLRSQVKGEMTELVAKVGTITVEGDVTQGVRIFIDDRDVGEWPLGSPVRVLGGVHEVRAEKLGFTPIQMKVEVAAGQPSVAKLVARQREARIDVREKHNWILRVELDGRDVGVTPLSKIVPVGEHRVRLRGYMRPDALLLCETPEAPVDIGARMESEEKVVALGLFETGVVEPSAEDVDASLRVESTPKGAALWVDGRDVGKTPWEGRLPLGEHAVEVRRAGFFATKQRVTLERRKPKDIAVALEREPDAATQERAAARAKLGVGLAYGLGGLGLGMFAVAGGLALEDVRQLRANCPNQQCPSTEDGRLQGVGDLSTIATVGVVIFGVGAAAGTTMLFVTRSDEHKHQAAQSVGVRLGLGNLGLEGRF